MDITIEKVYLIQEKFGDDWVEIGYLNEEYKNNWIQSLHDNGGNEKTYAQNKNRNR